MSTRPSILLVFLCLALEVGAAGPSLIRTVAGVGPEEKQLPIYLLRSRRVEVDPAALPGPSAVPGARTVLNLFPGVAPEVEWRRSERHAAHNHAWHGVLPGDPHAAVTLTVVGPSSILEVVSPEFGHFEVRTRSDGTSEVRQLHPEHSRGNGRCCVREPGAAAGGGGGEDAIALAAGDVAAAGSTIDVLMIYTAAAMDKAGGRSDIVAIAQAAVNGENGNFSRSGILHRMRLVNAREVGHTASGNLNTELGWVAGNSTVASIRSDVGADLVAFLSDKDDFGILGVAFQLSSSSGNSGQAFSANYYDTAAGVWPHEAGHNLGAGHNEDRNDGGLYSYSSGHHWIHNSKEYGSIMSYIGIRVPYFSNPDINWNGNPTGTSGRDNARTIDNTGDNVAAYRTAKTLIDPTVSVGASASGPYELRPFTYTITAINNGPSTATSVRLAVTLPSGLTLLSHNGGSAFSPSTGSWNVPSLGDGGRTNLVLTLQPKFGSQGQGQTVSATVASVGTGFVDFDNYNNSDSFTVTPRPEPAIPQVLVAPGTAWKYYDALAAPSSAWRSNSFQDAAWPAGPGLLGYGDANGVLPATTVASNGQVTTYFRREFVVGGNDDAVSLQVRLQRDDGAVVYLNGAEVWRDNMPAGTISHQTLALASISGSGETAWLTNYLDVAGLRAGTNLLAVEVHQNTNTSSDLSFHLAASLMIRTNHPPTVSLASPTANQVFGTVPARITVTANATDPEGAIDRVELRQDGVSFAVLTNSPYSAVVSNLPLNRYTFSAVVTDDRGLQATSAPVTVTVAGRETLVNTGAVWRFHDLGTDLGTAWRLPGYDDHTWGRGPSLLGFGDANGLDPVTLVASNGQITTYFRHEFPILHASRVTNLTARLRRDDGAVVYLNGAEVWRDNLPPTGPIGALTPALAAASGTAEDDWYTNATLNPALLVSGTNLLAIEVHQNTNTSSDLALDVILDAAYGGPTAVLPPDVLLTSPAPGLVHPQSEPLVLSALAAQPYGQVRAVQFLQDGAVAAEVTAPPYRWILPQPPLGLLSFRAVAEDATGRRTTSAVAQVTVRLAASASLIEPGAIWKFYDGTNDPGAAWRSNRFDDVSWDAGPSELGFGDGNEATLLASNRQAAFYFRREFFVPDAGAVARLTARMLRDDGAAVYLNGTEVWRDNLPPGAGLNHLSLALAAVTGGAELAWLTNTLNPALLVTGTNLLAVEVHQNSSTSSDLGFDFELLGLTVFPEAPRVEWNPAGAGSWLAWPAAAGALQLYWTTNLAQPDGWTRAPGDPVFSGGEWRFPLPPPVDGLPRFYRLQGN
ncbi:MAG: hypothetical protein RJA22_1515 [Verrucomicrobiota bacterium]